MFFSMFLLPILLGYVITYGPYYATDGQFYTPQNVYCSIVPICDESQNYLLCWNNICTDDKRASSTFENVTVPCHYWANDPSTLQKGHRGNANVHIAFWFIFWWSFLFLLATLFC